jgi:hypothetical protein
MVVSGSVQLENVGVFYTFEVDATRRYFYGLEK